MPDPRTARRLVALPLVVAALLVPSGCSWFGGDDDQAADTSDVGVLDVSVGDCLQAPTEEKTLVTGLVKVPCSEPHSREAFANITYLDVDGEPTDTYPGEDDLDAFAQGACAGAFTDYLGISYLDSVYYFTNLLPSPRSWEDDDHEVLCLITSTGELLTGSVKGIKQ